MGTLVGKSHLLTGIHVCLLLKDDCLIASVIGQDEVKMRFECKQCQYE